MSLNSSIRFPVLAGAILFLSLVLSGCGGAGTGGATPWSWSTGSESQLYVSGSNGDWLLSYNNAITVSGNVPPNRTVTGGNTLFNGPRGIAVDMARHQLYVANHGGNNILVFNNVRTLTGNIAPGRTIAGAATTLSGPSALFFDIFSDRLYVANTTDNSILVFENASTTAGNVIPSRTLKGMTTTLNAPSGVFVDITRNKLYVINGGTIGTGANSILVFDNAATVAGNTAPAHTISGGSTTLNSPSGGALDVFQDRLYVSNTGSDSILVFNDIATISGNKAPDRALTGVLTALDQPRDLYFDLAGDRLYVANAGTDSVLVFNNAGIITGNVAPNRNVALTPATTPYGVFVDVTPVVAGSSAALDGEAGSDGSTASAGGAPRTGDVEEFPGISTAYRQFYSFDLAKIPLGTIVTAAILRFYQASVSGLPYDGTMGSVVVDHVNYGTALEGTDFAAATLLGNAGTLSRDANLGYKILEVTGQMESDLNNARLRSQYRLRFSLSDANLDDNDDYVQYTDFEDSCCGVNRPPQLAIVIKP
ncbi:MAG: beta-propeller fold lactonase family protein [Gammaproteobacteria bacterium]|nr:beta-propeller fold lactonase family protein [Gammaproteobacteria bacterium]